MMADTYEDLLNPPANSYEDLVRQQTGPDYKPAPPDVQSGEEARRTYKALTGAAIVGGSAYLGGLPLAGLGATAELAGSTAGTFGGELLRQKAFSEPTSFTEAGKSAAVNLGLGTITKLATEAYGALGGLAPQYTRYVGKQNPIRGYGLTMREPPPTAELDLGRQIGQSVKAIQSKITAPRQELESMLARSSSSGHRISVVPVVKALEDAKVPNATLPETVRANAMLDERIAALRARDTAGGMTAKELDALINKELDPAAFNQSGEVATTKVGPAYSSAREAAKEQLLANLPTRARLLREQVADELKWRELAGKYFGLKKSGKSVVSNIKGIEAPGNEEIKQTLDFVSKESGIDFNKMAMDLATRRAYTMDDRVKINIMNRIMLGLAAGGVATGHPGVGAAAFATSPVVAHVVSKVIAPLQGVAGPGGTSLYEYLREKYGMRTSPTATTQGQSTSYNHTPVDRQAVQDMLQRVMRGGAGGSF